MVAPGWSDATKTGMVQLDIYYTFRDLGKYGLAPVLHNNLWLHLV